MSALAKIKKQAAQLEHDRQYDKALVLYARLLDESDGSADGTEDEIDVALYNRAGDVALRAGDSARAVTYYERALDRYATGGFLNNAIALGAKILRQAPERVATHYTLGVLYAKKGFRSDARQHFLSYAERMHRGGQANEVARSLADYVVLCDGPTDARAGLAAHLAAGAARPADVAAKLADLLEQALHAAGQLDDGSPAGAGALADRDLVFLDLDPAALGAAAGASAPQPDELPAWEPPAADAPLELLGDAFDPGYDDGFDGARGGLVLDVPADLPTAHPTSAPAWEPEAPRETALVRLLTLPGELPPLAPSLVALDSGVADDWSVAVAEEPSGAPTDGLLLLEADVADLPASSYDVLDLADDAPSGVPAFADEVDPSDPADVQGSLIDLPLLGGPAELDLELPSVLGAAPIADVPPEPELAPELALLVLDEEPAPVRAPEPAAAAPVPDDDGIDLGAWLRESEPAPSTRLVAAAMPTTGDEQADFQATLQAFKAGIARSLADADFDAHYDLGVAYKEMGLLEEAIGEFQKAARAPGQPLRALEALADCFLERGEPQLVLSALAATAPALAVGSPGVAGAPQHVALCYLLGAASQEVGRTDDARSWFLRVLATDYAFRDAATRLASLSPPTR
jgi:tetratricopeptide (TPR) repeat protein